MSNQDCILLEANDCCPFQNQADNGEAIQHFISNTANWNIFRFSANLNKEEIPEIVLFNNRDAQWYAGRLVGEAIFDYKGQNYKINITPRFGVLQLLRMLEEIFNVRFSESKNSLSMEHEFQYLIKKLISFLWLNMLANANKHGLPKYNVEKIHKGATIRGSLNVRKSVNPLYLEKQLISRYKEKALDKTVVNILKQAYKILLHDYYLGSLNIPSNALDAIEQLKSSGVNEAYISEGEYKKIAYKDIYLSFKPVVDLSWDIIRKKNIGNNRSDSNKKSFSFFIDMAEIWELYLKSLLKKHLAKDGWRLRNDLLLAYPQKNIQKKMIPDIVFQKDDSLMVWDAKYKRMKFDYFDYDREDFFQIHTYINYYHQIKKVIAGGLLFPITKPFDLERQNLNKSATLFGKESTQTFFVIDGIDFSEYAKEDLTLELIKKEEHNFIERISALT